ncbi:hypothetical protein FA13DRAFT_1602385, partial [Coprinellus micaceus]
KVAVPGAETGRPETGREFAARMKDRFVLKGPREPKEGAGEKNINPPNSEEAQGANTPHNNKTGSGPKSEPPPPSLIHLVKDTMGIDITDAVKRRYEEDQFFKLILESPKDYRNFEVDPSGLVYQQSDGGRVLCIPKILYKGRSIREIVIAEAHTLLAHLSARKTIAYLRDHVWWK